MAWQLFTDDEVGFAFRTNRGRGSDQRLAWSPFDAVLHYISFQRLNPPTDAAQREEDVPRGELDLDRARLSGDSDREGTFQ